MNWKGPGRKLSWPVITYYTQRHEKPRSGQTRFVPTAEPGASHCKTKLYHIFCPCQVMFFASTEWCWCRKGGIKGSKLNKNTKANERSQQSMFKCEASGNNANTITRSHVSSPKVSDSAWVIHAWFAFLQPAFLKEHTIMWYRTTRMLPRNTDRYNSTKHG